MKRKALISGITGMDGSYLADLLLEKGYEVHGIVRRVALENPILRLRRICHLTDVLHLHSASLECYTSLCKVFEKVQPQECYHLAAQSFVPTSFEDEFSTWKINVNGTRHILAALEQITPTCKLYFAASSEMFGNASESPQSETTPFNPQSIYGISKVAGFHLTQYYREKHGIFACNGILFNHESPRRGMEFVTRKISDGVAKIKRGLTKHLILGNTSAWRDWGHAKDYVRAMWLMLQQDKPDDYVIATGKVHSVQGFVEIAFDEVGLDWKDYLEFSKEFLRPREVHHLVGNPQKAKEILGWEPEIDFVTLVREMVRHDLERYSNGKEEKTFNVS